jgi:hypothetical protein
MAVSHIFSSSVWFASYDRAIADGSPFDIAYFVYSGSGTIPSWDNSLIALGRAAAYIVSRRQTMRFARELPKNRRRTEVPVPYCGSPVPSAGTLKALKI